MRNIQHAMRYVHSNTSVVKDIIIAHKYHEIIYILIPTLIASIPTSNK